MAPPTKRRKRNILPSSSEEDDDDEPVTKVKAKAPLSNLISSSPPSSTERQPSTSSKSPAKTGTGPKKMQPRAKTANHSPNAAPIHLPDKVRGAKVGTKSASSSPEKSKRKGKSEDKVKSGDIYSFFTKQAQRQQAERGSGSTAKPKLTVSSKSSKIEDEDLISDDDVFESKAPTSSVVGTAARKRSRTMGLPNGDGDLPSASQKFIVPKAPPEIKHENDMRPWAERFAPTNLDELAVHKKKVSDVRRWLEDVMCGHLRQRLLILKGAAGTAKTTTLQLLAKAMDCDVLEWRNPVGSVASSDGFLSMSAQFEEFMGRGGKFGQLDIFSTEGKLDSKADTQTLECRKNLILIEEFPNTFTRSSTVLQSFRSTVISYLASNTPPLSMTNPRSSKEPITPVVMIISETLLTTTSASADSFTAHRLLGPEILRHPGVAVIEFNAIAPTFLAKALELVVQKESRKSGRRKTPGPQVLKTLGEIGDIRSAIGSLEFLCLRGDVDGDWGAKIAFGKAKKASKDTALTKMEKESLELVTRREASLGIFHAVGKVVYNRRDETVPEFPADEDTEKLPSFMSNQSRPHRSQIKVDELIDETGTDTQTFVAALHENYLLSCNAPPTSFEFSTLDHVSGCIDCLSDSDLLCSSWDGSFNASGFGGGYGGKGTGGDIMRQDEISFQIAVRGIIFSLPFPVKRTAPPAGGLRSGKGRDAFKMFYPTSLKLWRMKEELESTIDLWVSKLMKGEDHQLSAVTAGAAAFARPKAGTVESWKSPGPQANHSGKASSKDAEIAPLLSTGTSARKEMLLDRLPYMVTIARAKKSASSTFAIREMEKVTTFHGIGGPTDDVPDEADEAVTVGEEWATDKPGESKSPRTKALVIRGRDSSNRLSLQQELNLVLSDDDIEDD
ncbi:related to cell cycle checkpoint protein RAD17 [Rhynchosporium agropyri]|uniref:Related to cell cycle checkpoint protein RAD17 n=1 Tax=Rhynchosporium agropyri TaxID=914238 RepID=A0A1E1JRY8_9HELO|nr:related to cell cycle checkpoint protein RAD17 [Rhynchosporium agropyri]